MSTTGASLIALTLITCIAIFIWEVWGSDISRWWEARKQRKLIQDCFKEVYGEPKREDIF